MSGKLQNSDEQNQGRNEWMDNSPYSWIGRLNVVKTSVIPNVVYRLSAIPIKITVNYFVDTDKLILKFIW
jgi:hypothetical protein